MATGSISGILQLAQQMQQMEERKEAREHDRTLMIISEQIKQEGRLKEVELQGTIQEFYDLRQQREEVGAQIRKDYARIDPKFVTQNFRDVSNTFQGVAEDDMGNLQKSIGVLSQDLTKLKNLSQDLAAQKSYYKGQEQAIAGITTLIDPGEFESFVEKYKEEHPGEPTAGLYAGYEEGKVDTYTRRQAADKMQGIYKASAQSNWDSIRSLAPDIEIGEHTNDPILQKEIGKMIGHVNYQDVVNYMNAEQTGRVKDIFYDMFPSLMGAMEGHVAGVDVIETEFLGKTKETHVQNITDKLLENVSGASNKEAFALYHTAQAQLTNEEDKRDMFIQMEQKLDRGNLGELYREELGIMAGLSDKKPVRVALKEPILEKYTATQDESQAEQIYEALDTIEAEMKVSEEGLSGKYMMAGPGELLAGAVGLGGRESFPGREDWTPAKAMFGGLGSLDIGVDSPYYDAFYDEVQDQFANLISEEDPFGPDFLYSRMPEEHQVPGLIKDRYGDAVWDEVFKVADEVGKKAQIEEIEKILEKESGEDYWDLVRALDAIK